MEAANLGGYLAGLDPDAALDEALALLAAVPSFRPVGRRLGARRLRGARRGSPAARDSLGIPTWFYGHEPPNVLRHRDREVLPQRPREAVLLEVCDAGIVFLPGAGGTVQEVFQDACENYYADESSVAPMVLVGATYWTETLPAWPLLAAAGPRPADGAARPPRRRRRRGRGPVRRRRSTAAPLG